ncbi:MAG: DUF3160 domain-containing protein [Clostridia bacterium]|nr:DUF3160 domain-containing protein [Clostridia bacterium]
MFFAITGRKLGNAAERNLGFFAVAAKLLDPQASAPDVVEDVVAEELALIEENAGIQYSPLMNMGQTSEGAEAFMEDYSQYIPRGHYAENEQLQRYFKAMMWCGRMTFRLSSEDETKSAILITLALEQDKNQKMWDKIYQPTNFFVGKSDDLSYMECGELLKKVHGSGAGLKDITSDIGKWKEFMKETANLDPPAINSMPIFEEEIQPDREQEIKGFRFMGQRFTLDAAIFQRLVYRDVGKNSRGARRMLPRALDIPAALVADVVTDPNGQVLEETTGPIFPIYVVVQVDGKLKTTSLLLG